MFTAKRMAIVLAIVGLAVVPATAMAGVTVTSPNGGENWWAGTNHTITWNRTFLHATYVKIELYRNGSFCRLITANTSNDGSFTWNVTKCGIASSGYRIKISEHVGSGSDMSNGSFTISPIIAVPLPVGFVSVTSPNGGEIWQAGLGKTITWNKGIFAGAHVKIELYRNGVKCKTITPSTPNDGSRSWHVAKCGTASGGYKIKITDVERGYTDYSNSTFTIGPILLPQPVGFIRVNSPNGGELLTAGASKTITWSKGILGGSQVKIELYRNGSFCRLITASTPNDGARNWIVAKCGIASSGYKIKITDIARGYTDYSNATFTILPLVVPQPIGFVSVTSPNGGESWPSGGTRNITWNKGVFAGSHVKIELYRNGVKCKTITPSTPNDGSRPWTVAKCGLNSAGYKVKVTDLTHGYTDYSNSVFTITPIFLPPPPVAVLHVNSPNGGEHWLEGSTKTITWSRGVFHGPNVKIELYRNGALCKTITSSTPNDGSRNWTVAQCGNHQSGYKIKITDLTTPAVDYSNNTFTIDEDCHISVTQPNGGEHWLEGSSKVIKWNRSGSCGGNVKIELWRDGSIVKTLFASTPNDGAKSWNPVAQDGNHTGNYKIRVTHLGSGASDMSNNRFFIDEKCNITVTQPNGGEHWEEGSSKTIRWNHAASCGANVKIELLRGGSVVKTLAASTPNDGAKSWNPVAQDGNHTGNYKIRVTDLDSGARDASNSSFTIDDSSACPPGPCSGELVIAPASGVAGQQVEVMVRFESSSAAVDAFGIDLEYDTDILQFVAGSAQPGSLTESWMHCSAEENAAGVVTIGGFHTAAIPAGATGAIVRLTFDVVCASCSEGDESAMQLNNLLDDVAGMTSCCGTFTYGLFCQSDGDVDGNGTLSPGDGLCAFQIFMAGQAVPAGCDADGFDCELKAADVDCDATVTPSDALSIFNRALSAGAPEACFAETPAPQAMAPGAKAAAAAAPAVGDRNLYHVELDAMQTMPDGRIYVPVTMIARAGQAAFGFELAFDPETMDFVELEVERAGSDWKALAANEVEPGRLLVGGLGPEGLKPAHLAAAQGEGTVLIATLEFQGKSASPSFGAVDWKTQVVGQGDAESLAGTPSISRLALGQPFPNPLFRGDRVQVNLSLPEGAMHDVKVSIFDVQGRMVRSLVQGQMPGGAHLIEWDRTADNSASVGSGIYFLRLRAGSLVENRKIVVVE